VENGGSHHALRVGVTIEAIWNLAKLDCLYLLQIHEVVDFVQELATLKTFYEIFFHFAKRNEKGNKAGGV